MMLRQFPSFFPISLTYPLVTPENVDSFYNNLYTQVSILIFRAILPVFFLVFGFGKVEKKYFSIYDFLPEYEPIQDTSVAPIIVSNHAGFLDVFYYWMENTAFLAKAHVSDLPILGI